MRHVLGSVLWGWLLLMLTAAVLAETPEDWLAQMVDKQRDLTYRGRFVYVQGQNIESMEILFQRQQGKEQQRLTALNDTPREIIVGEDGKTYVVTSEGITASRTQRNANAASFPLAHQDNLERIRSTYALELRRTGRIAGRAAVNIAVLPRDAYRFGYDLWLDRETAVVLRSALLDEKQQPIETMTFTDFMPIDAVTSPYFAVHSQGQPLVHETRELPPSNPPLKFGGLPSGFQPVSQRRYQQLPNEATVEQVVLSDGLATVSVFLERLASPLEGPYRLGVMSAYGKVTDNLQITALGEVPLATVAAIVNNLQLPPKN